MKRKFYFLVLLACICLSGIVNAQIPANGLVAWYPFNGNAYDESGNGNNGTASGASLTSDRNGNSAKAYQFNGTNNYIELLHPLPVDSIFTISFWAFNNMDGRLGNIICDGGSSDGGNDFLLNLTADRIGIRADKGGKPLNYEDYSPATLTQLNISNRWINVTWVMTPATSTIYLDGVSIAQINEAGTNMDYHDMNAYIGARHVWGSPDNFFNGKIDDIRIYNRALNSSEISSLYSEVKYSEITLDTKIIGKDTLCSGVASEYSINVNANSNKYLFRDTTAAFSGTNGFFALNTGYPLELISNTFSFDLWIKPTRTINMAGESNSCAGDVSVPLANSNQNWALVPAGLAGGNMGVGLTIGTNGLMVGEHSGNILVSRLSYTVPITDWVHVAIVYRTDSIFLFLNGKLVRSRKTPCTSNLKYATSALTGYYYAPDFKGDIDEFRLWDIPLTRQEVKIIKDTKLMNQVSGLRYYAGFDNGKFERTLGDIGARDMVVSHLSADKNIKTSTWDLNKFSGTSINSLTPFSGNDLSFLWSTGATTNTTTFTPKSGINYLTVTTYNSSFSKIDTLVIFGKNCTSPPNDGLVANYPFNGNANDESGNGNNGTVNGASLTTDRFGNANKAYQFNGIDNFIELLHPLPVDNTFTISFWAYNQMENGNTGNIINDGSVNLGGNDFLLNLQSDRIGIRADKGEKPLNYEYGSPTGMTDLNMINRWCNITWVMTPAASNIYLDGVLIAQINEEGTNTDYHDLNAYIGARRVWSSADNFFNGKIDDISIYNRALTKTEIATLFNNSASISTIKVSPDQVNGGTTVGGGMYQNGVLLTITASANPGWSFVNWTENGNIVSTNSSYSFVVKGNRTLVANFTQHNLNSITTSANPTIGGTISGSGTYANGTMTTVLATPNADWIFLIWTENGKIVSTNASYSFTVTENRNLVANFMQQKFKIATTANPTIGGAISGGGTYNYSNMANLTAAPNAGWYFVNWTEGGDMAATDSTYSFNVTESRTLTANFTKQRIFIAADANPGPGGITQGGGYYGVGSTASVIATPVSGYTFIDWSESGKQVSTNPVYDFTANTNRTLIANFHLTTGIEENQFSIEIFPNPTSAIVNVKSSQIMDKIVICNSMGAIVKNIGSRQSDYRIDLSGLTKGIYILRLYIDNMETTQKIVLN